MELLIFSLFAGILTVASPCILPILPVILGGTLGNSSWKKGAVVIVSLGVSIFAFTLLLKVSSLFINVPLSFWTILSGVIILLFGLVLLFPRAWENLSFTLKLYKSDELIQSAEKKEGFVGAVLLGAALGPVFSSCSPTYSLILATVLPQNLSMGIINLLAYCIGLMIPLFAIVMGGQAVIARLKFLANPNGLFRKVLGTILILTGFLIVTGLEKKIETFLIEHGIVGTTGIESTFVDTLDTKNLSAINAQKMPVSSPATSTGSVVLDPNKKKVNYPFTMNYAAPELEGLFAWFNSKPLTLADLKGKVILVDFWTFSCINCIRTLPYMEMLHEKYASQGLVVVGIHAPEFSFEKVPANVEASIKERGLHYPIALDNDFKTWNAFNNRYWPAKYLIDMNGNIRYTHFGEGEYDKTEKAVQALLTELNPQGIDTPDVSGKAVAVDMQKIETPELYVGYSRQDAFGGGSYPHDQPHDFMLPGNIEKNNFYLEGNWIIQGERAVLNSEKGKIVLRYKAPKANIVLKGNGVKTIVRLDGKDVTAEELGADVKLEQIGRELMQGIFTITGAKLYNVVDTKEDSKWRTVELEFTGKGVEVYAYTFG